MPSDNIDSSKVVEDVNLLPEIISIVKNILVNFGTPIIDEVHVSPDSISVDVDEIVETNIPTVPSQSFESPCVKPSFMFIPINSSFTESPEFLAKVEKMVSNNFFRVV